MYRIISIFAIVFMSLLSMFSCQKDTNSVSLQDDEAVVEELAVAEDSEYLFDLGIDDKNEDFMFNGYSSFGSGFGKVTAPIDTVLRYGRKVIRPPRRGIIDFRRISPDTIRVFLARGFAGQFFIFEKGEDTTGTRPIIIHRKRLNHVAKRNATFVRRTSSDVNSDHGRRHWRLAEVSLGQGNSRPEATIRINEISVVSSNGDSLGFVDPLHTFLEIPDDIPSFVPGDVVTVTVKLVNTTANPVDPFGNGSTETLLLHYGTNRHHHARKEFDYVGEDPITGDQVYQGTWRIGQEPFRAYHAVIDAIDNGTIYDDDASTYPYNSMTWGIPYRVVDSTE